MKLSIIVPVYNVEAYLHKCVDSVLCQDYKDYEIILVDDGSTDNSGVICDEYVSSRLSSLGSPLIRVIHQANAGLSAARNSGIKAANGEYICFVDSDDYWQPNVLGGLMEQVSRDNLDVLRFKFQNVNERYEVFNPYKRDNRLDNDYSVVPTDGVSFLNSRMNTQCYAVMFILRRDLIIKENTSYIIHNTFEKDSCLFTEGIFFEDTDWTPRMLCRAKRIASTDTIVYNYLVREGSITNAVNRNKLKKVLDDKIRLVGEMQRQALVLRKTGRSNLWYQRMISDLVVSIIGMLSIEFYTDRDMYLKQLQVLDIYPIHPCSFKARLINFSPEFATQILHIKNKWS